MAITPYCDEDDIEFVWSEFGVTVRADDNADGSADTGVIDQSVERGCTIVNEYLLGRYTVAVIAASSWAKWCAAYIAAVTLGKRRGNTIPESMAAEVAAYMETLKLIKSYQEHLMADTGPATPRHDSGIVVSNVTIDGRYPRSKVRRIPATSTGPNQADGLKRHDEQTLIYE